MCLLQKMEPKEEPQSSSQDIKLKEDLAVKPEEIVKTEVEQKQQDQHTAPTTAGSTPPPPPPPPTVIKRHILTAQGKTETDDQLEVQNEETVNTSELSPDDDKTRVAHEVVPYELMNQDSSTHSEHFAVTTEAANEPFQQPHADFPQQTHQQPIYTLEITNSEGTTVPVTIESTPLGASADYANLETAQYSNGPYPPDGSQYLQQHQYSNMQYQLDRSSGESPPININNNVLVRNNDPTLASSRYHHQVSGFSINFQYSWRV